GFVLRAANRAGRVPPLQVLEDCHLRSGAATGVVLHFGAVSQTRVDTMGAMAGPRTVRVTRYVTPLREGGSLPAIVEADDEGLYVLKFRGAGQGARALIAELVSGEIGRTLGLPV